MYNCMYMYMYSPKSYSLFRTGLGEAGEGAVWLYGSEGSEGEAFTGQRFFKDAPSDGSTEHSSDMERVEAAKKTELH